MPCRGLIISHLSYIIALARPALRRTVINNLLKPGSDPTAQQLQISRLSWVPTCTQNEGRGRGNHLARHRLGGGVWHAAAWRLL